MENKNKIIELTPELYNMISAGEVVERPLSVVKELVENSIDALASVIRIDLMTSGIDKITVIDNGIGMSEDDISLSVKSHATSKIRLASDLFSINTLGFRGEALPSISSVSKMRITSSVDGFTGYFKAYEAGTLIDEGIVSFPKGTKIEVNEMFFNTPARFKHLSSEQVELSHIMQFVNKMALAYPEVSFILTNNAKVLFSTDGSSNKDAILAEIYGSDIAKKMIGFEGTSSLYKISGRTSNLSINRSNKNAIIMMINKRVIKNQNLTFAILDAYKTYLPLGKYPITVLEIDTDPILIDVNVHPTKQDVRFTDEKELRYLITSTISNALNSVNLAVNVDSVNFNENKIYEKEIVKETKKSSFSWDDFKPSSPVSKNEPKKVVNELTKEEIVSDDEEFTYSFTEEKPKVDFIKEVEKVEVQTLDLNINEKASFFSSMNYIGQFNKTYLLFEKEESLYLIDQHAAMERVMYERISNIFEKEALDTFELLVPIKLEFLPSEVILIENIKEEIEKVGICFDVFGKNTIVIRKIPTWIKEKHAEEFTHEIISGLINGKNVSRKTVLDNIAKTISCKSSIKANMFILKEEVNNLLKDLDNCKNPYTCPHGRPTVIHFTNYEIEKLFKRVM